VLGFTETGLIPKISAAGATPADRKYTAIADAEFLYNGPQPNPKYPLPPLHVGASPVLISRAVIAAQQIPIYLFDAGLPRTPTVPVIDLGGSPARCLSQGKALDLSAIEHLLQQGLRWGAKLSVQVPDSYVILGECVVGGTTTALGVLTGLGISAAGKINSSHPTCNHNQKWQLVEAGLRKAGLWRGSEDAETRRHKDAEKSLITNNLQLTTHPTSNSSPTPDSRLPTPVETDPLHVVAAVGDPMQIAVAGMAIAASRTCGVLLAGGTQMLAIYALLRAIAQHYSLPWNPERIIVGTTRWVAEDPTGNTVGLANLIGSVPLMATQLSFKSSRFSQLQAYEQGYVKEGVGAGGCSIAAHLYQNWGQMQLLSAIEQLAEHYQRLNLQQKPGDF
jgi:NaMN:DMB phosphoribosyltransferase